MSESKGWTLVGRHDAAARNSTFGLVYAVMIAITTFQSHNQRYNIGTCVIIIAAGLYIAKVEHVIIDEDTKMREFRRELQWNAAYHRFAERI